ncbi:MAG: lipocalin family protein [Chitinophagaceae bacterium]|nr:lipocalin family protein [Chitinophagaceae bacterium]
MRSSLNTILLLSFACLLTVSCKKKKSETFEALLGSWKLKKVAVDNNGNGTMDADEIVKMSNPVPQSTFLFERDRNGMFFTIYKDTTGRVVSDNTRFLYSVDGTDLTIENTNDRGLLSNGKRVIEKISFEEMTLREPTTSKASWRIYSKM